MPDDAVTILITDMEGSTAFTDARGDEPAMEVLRTHERITRTTIASFDGREIKSMGDGFMVTFGDASSAVACSLAIVDAFDEHNHADPDSPIRVRIGLNRGPVIEEGGDIYGTAVNAAARIGAKARSGQILVAESVRDACVDYPHEFVDRGLFWLKGLRERWRLFEVRAEGQAAIAYRDTSGRTPFVGRDDERAALRVHVDAALDGRGGVVLLTGEPGAGKTRLAEEVGAEAEGRGMRVLIGRGYEATRSHPFALIVEILEVIQRDASPLQFRMILGEYAGEVARLMPQLRRRFPDVPEPTDIPPEQERRFLIASLREVLAGLARQRPILLFFDDLHWADDLTVFFIEQIAPDLIDLPILLMATYPGPGIAQTPALESLIGQLERRRQAERLTVGPLALEEATRLLEAIVGLEPPHDLVHQLHSQTEGNAFFFEEVVRHLAGHGRLLDAEGRWLTDVVVELDVPDTVRMTIARRLEYLTDNTRRILNTAAVIGRAFGFELLEDLAQISEDGLLDALDEAERVRLIDSSSDAGVVRFQFAHELIRQTLIGDVSLTRRQMLHLRIADAIERIYEATLDEHAATIAYHLESAGQRADADRTVRFLLLAGDRALEAAAFEEAMRHFESARALTADVATRALTLEKLGVAERSLEHLDEAMGAWREALDAYEALGDHDSIARLCLDAGFQIALWKPGRWLLQLIDRGLKAVGDRRTAHRGGLLALSAALESDAGNYDRADELFEEATDLVREDTDTRILGMTLYLRCYHHFVYQEFAKTIELATEAVEHLRNGREVWTLANALNHLSSAIAWSGRFDDAAEIAGEAEALGRRLGNWAAYYSADRMRAFRHLGRDPDLARFEDDGKRDYELGHRLEIRWLTATGRGRMALAAFWRGRWSEALAFYAEAAGLEASVASGGHIARLAMCHAYLGNRSEALDLVEQARPRIAVPGGPNTTTAWLAALVSVETLAVLDERDAAARLYPIVQDAISMGMVMRAWDFRLVHTVAGIAASCASRWSDSERHFQEALRLGRDLPLKLEVPEARRFYARMLIDRGDPGDATAARQQISRAGEEYATIGMPAHERLLRELFASA